MTSGGSGDGSGFSGPPSSATEPTIGAFEFKTALAQAGLDRYEQILRENGFLGWEEAAGITEDDMAEMGFRLGDRRKLQRVMRNFLSSNRPKASPSPRTPQDLPRKRAYRRHPRADQNAPIRPKTAYVLFGEHVQQDPDLRGLSFTNLAKETGRRWKEISDAEKERSWDAPATAKLKEYREELERYKRTEDYHVYQRYLEEFRQGQSDSDRVDSPGRRDSNTSDLHPFVEIPRGQVPSNLSPVASRSSDQFNTSHQNSDNREVQSMDVDSDNTAIGSQDLPVAVKAGLEEVERISRNLGINPETIRVSAFPHEHITTKSVETFLRCTGALVYFWSYEDAIQKVHSLYRSPIQSNSTAIVEVFAMAAIGSYCDGHPDIKSSSDMFLRYFVYMASSPVYIGDLHRMRLFACLAICLFTSNVGSARRLMSSALDIGRQAFASESFKAETSEADLQHWWNVLRSVIFLESWFAYNTHQESRITHADLTLYQTPSSDTVSSSEMYHQRIFELGRLATYVALDLKRAVDHPQVAHAHKYLDSLTQWHKTLPPPMQLSSISISDPLTLDWHTKRSLLQLHIVFLGLFIEPYRNCLIDLGSFRIGDTNKSISKEDLEALISIEDQCVSAARQSARVASLLQFDNLVRSHCWVSLYTSYVGCTVLLYSASQRLLQGTREDVGLELAYASAHIGVLSICSYENSIAKRMYTSLQILFNDVRDVLATPEYSAPGQARGGAKYPNTTLPLSQVQEVVGPEDVRRNVIDIAKRVVDIMESKINF